MHATLPPPPPLPLAAAIVHHGPFSILYSVDVIHFCKYYTGMLDFFTTVVLCMETLYQNFQETLYQQMFIMHK